jgi:aminoglycoside 3-N-acetyltransferase I
MSFSAGVSIHQLTRDDHTLMTSLLAVFGEAFGELETYVGNRPNAGYLQQRLGSDCFIALVALKNGEVVAGIAAYELKKFEQERSEIYPTFESSRCFTLHFGAATRTSQLHSPGG